MSEQWLPVRGHEGLYEVSDQGNVRSVHHVIIRSNGVPFPVSAHLMKPTLVNGYPNVTLSHAGKSWCRRVHTLVLDAFVGPRPQGMVCCHIDGVRTNNLLSNLRWGTSSENNYDIVRHGHHHDAGKTHCPRGHALVAPNLVHGSLARGKRECRACNQARASRRTGAAFEAAAQAKYMSLMGAAGARDIWIDDDEEERDA